MDVQRQVAKIDSSAHNLEPHPDAKRPRIDHENGFELGLLGTKDSMISTFLDVRCPPPQLSPTSDELSFLCMNEMVSENPSRVMDSKGLLNLAAPPESDSEGSSQDASDRHILWLEGPFCSTLSIMESEKEAIDRTFAFAGLS
jgi:hypothetical protein